MISDMEPLSSGSKPMNSDSEPLSYISSLLLLFGINLDKTAAKRTKWCGILKITICLIWVSEIVLMSWCFKKTSDTPYLIASAIHTMSFSMWGLVCYQRKKYVQLMRAVRKIRKPSRVIKMLTILTLTLIFALTVLPLLFLTYTKATSQDNFQCRFDWDGTRTRSFTVIFISVIFLLGQLLSFVFFYSFTALYIFICIEVNNAINAVVRLATKGKSQHNIKEVKGFYNTVRDALKGIEDTMSNAIFFTLAICYMSIFRSISYSLTYAKTYYGRLYHDFIYSFYIIGIVSVFVSVVLVSDNLQRSFSQLGRVMIFCYEAEPVTCCLLLRDIKECLSLKDTSKRIRLTAWNMFSIRRSVLTTSVALLISYSLALYEFEFRKLPK